MRFRHVRHWHFSTVRPALLHCGREDKPEVLNAGTEVGS
jgi:hypothetical protein